MRLTTKQATVIKNTITSLLGASCNIRLFGSRVDDQAKGGDIDLFIEAQQVQSNRASIASRIAASLQISLGDRRIDVILVDPTTPPQPIHKHARQHGLLL